MLEMQGLVAFGMGMGMWMETKIITKCLFLQSYYTPIHITLVVVIVINIANVIIVFRCKINNSIRQFILILCGIIVFEAVAMILSAVYASNINNSDLLIAMTESRDGWLVQKEDNLECWVSMHSRSKCCGVYGHNDWLATWNTSNFSNDGSNDQVLRSCLCENTDCTTLMNISIFNRGCHNTMSDLLTSMYTIVRAFFTMCVLLQIVRFALTYVIFYKLNKKTVVDVYKQTDIKAQSFQESHL